MITVINDLPVLGNDRVSWHPVKVGDRYGLGSFYVNDRQVGGSSDCFLEEEVLGQKFLADSFEIVEDSKEKSVLRMKGYDGKLRFSVDITLLVGSCGFAFDFTLDPELPICHRLAAPIPFNGRDCDFVKYPYESTVFPDRKKPVRYECSVSTEPVLFGREKSGGYLAVGYDIRDRFTDGAISYDPEEENAGFRIVTLEKAAMRQVSMQLTWRNDTLRELDYDEEMARAIRHFRFVVAAGASQFDALKGYMDNNGYSTRVICKYQLNDCMNDLFDFLKNTKGFVEGKGYRLMVRADNGDYDNTVVRSGYGVAISCPSNITIAQHLYNYYLRTGAEWAKERAGQIVEFAIATQLPEGPFTSYNTDTGLTNGKVRGLDFDSYSIGIFNTGTAIRNLILLARKASKDFDTKPWMEAALRCGRFLEKCVTDEGVLGRNYNLKGEFDSESSGVAEALLALSYCYEETGEEAFDIKRRKLEEHVWKDMISYNLWMNSSHDSGAWEGSKGSGNNDSMFLSTFIAYCARMHSLTREQKYINMAKDVLMYEWAIGCPVDMPGFRHRTRMITREQDFYVNYDAPFKAQDYPAGYQYLAKEADEPFFMELFRIMCQTEMDLEAREFPYKGMNLGLDADMFELKMKDESGEGKILIPMVVGIFASAMFAPLSYAYAGGADWGAGVDYAVPFDQKENKGLPYVTCCTSMVRNVARTEEGMSVWVYDPVLNEADLEISFDGTKFLPEETLITYNGKTVAASECMNANKRIVLHLIGDGSPSKMVFLKLKQ